MASTPVTIFTSKTYGLSYFTASYSTTQSITIITTSSTDITLSVDYLTINVSSYIAATVNTLDSEFQTSASIQEPVSSNFTCIEGTLCTMTIGQYVTNYDCVFEYCCW